MTDILIAALALVWALTAALLGYAVGVMAGLKLAPVKSR
jgi:hypothetical protein